MLFNALDNFATSLSIPTKNNSSAQKSQRLTSVNERIKIQKQTGVYQGYTLAQRRKNTTPIRQVTQASLPIVGFNTFQQKKKSLMEILNDSKLHHSLFNKQNNHQESVYDSSADRV